MARKEPILMHCPDCGVEVWTRAATRIVRCPECRKARDLARAKQYYHDRRNDPERMKLLAERTRKYRRENPEKVRQSQKEWRKKNADRVHEAWKAYYAAHAQELRERSSGKWRKYYSTHREAVLERLRLARRARKGVVSAIMELKGRRGELMECPRLHIKTSALPCGKREECFGARRCEKCPPNATPPTLWDKPWITNPTVALEW